jgi:hypothetical protein
MKQLKSPILLMLKKDKGQLKELKLKEEMPIT